MRRTASNRRCTAGPRRILARRTRTRRGAVMSMELILSVPILLVVLMAVFEYSMLFFARGEVVHACRLGARLGTLPGVGPAAVDQEVRRALSPSLQRRAVVEYSPGERPGDLVSVVVRVPMRAAAPDLLWPIGLGIGSAELIAETRMARE